MAAGSLVSEDYNALAARPMSDPSLPSAPARSLVDIEAAFQAAHDSVERAMNAPTLPVSGTHPIGPGSGGSRGLGQVNGLGQVSGHPVPQSIFLSYELGPRIGAGGMGTVHRARHLWLGRTVAIKFISPTLIDSPDMVERFRHEALAIGRLAHPNIVQATDAGRHEGVHYLVTEFIEGIDLSSLVRKQGWLEVSDACEVVRQTALGLAHAHDRGIVHRDVKPGNLLLAHDGTIKLLDFGLARLAAGKTMLTNTGQILGTLDFLAPEQAADARRVDPRGDQYSLGCTLYFLLTGEAPFSGPAYDSPASKLKAHLTDQPRSVREVRQRIPLAVMAILERMMAKLPGDRFESALDVAEALAPHCRDADLAALAGGDESASAQRSGRATRRNYSAAAELVERAAAVFGWALSRGKRSGGGLGGEQISRKAPVFSITGLALLGVIAFALSKVSCIEIEEEIPGPDGTPTKAKVIEFGFGNVNPGGAVHPAHKKP